MPHALGDDERPAAEGDTDVVVPAGEAPAFEVVEPKLSLQVFVETLGPPALHDEPDELPPCESGAGARYQDSSPTHRLARPMQLDGASYRSRWARRRAHPHPVPRTR